MALAMFNGWRYQIAIARHFNVTRQTIYTLLKPTTADPRHNVLKTEVSYEAYLPGKSMTRTKICTGFISCL